MVQVKLECVGVLSASISMDCSSAKIPLRKESRYFFRPVLTTFSLNCVISTTFSFSARNLRDQGGIKSSKIIGDKARNVVMIRFFCANCVFVYFCGMF